MDLNDLDGSFSELGPRLFLSLSAAQMAAAESGDAYVAAALAEQGIDGAADGRLRPRSLAGVASDGRPLESLLRAPVALAKRAVGARVPDPLGAGGSLLDMIVQTQVADARRVAASVSMMSRPAVRGYVRVVNLPACGRCLILAGRYYRTRDSAAFLRHPRCDCTAEPTNDRSATTDTLEGFQSMSVAEQDKAFTKAGAQAVRDGADPSRVVNARRGMSTTVQHGRTYRTTTEGTTRRGRLPGQARGARLMPEAIYDLASDRDDAIRLLRRFGYLR
jgi:hypothetical protein